jgi:glycosyltransferase involved in cell wall biosynthesis
MDAMNNKSIPLSIVIPVYNRVDFIDRVWQSLVEQDFRPFEIVWVDNGSNDGSWQRCLELQQQAKAQEPNLTVQVLRVEQPGANIARNAGFMASTGDYVLFFDSDDRFLPNALNRIWKYLIRFRKPTLLGLPFVIRTSNGKQLMRPNSFSKDPRIHLMDHLLPTHGVVIKRALIEEVGLWDEEISRWQDLEFGFRLLLKSDSLAWAKGKPFYEVFDHKNSISGKPWSEDHLQIALSLNKIGHNILMLNDSTFKSRLQMAWAFRMVTLASLLYKEGSKELAYMYWVRAASRLPAVRHEWTLFWLKMHYAYTRSGGRGFWRIARYVLK